jgi:hypothetical protein
VNPADPDQTSILRDFLEGIGIDHRGRRLDDVLSFDDIKAEQTHDFIQWLFPLDEISRAISGAPILSQTDIQLIHTNSVAQTNIRRSAAWFLGFLERSNQWRTKYNHNHLRITRVIKSLRLLTDDKKADEFKAAIFDLLGDDLDLIDRKAVEFWEGA